MNVFLGVLVGLLAFVMLATNYFTLLLPIAIICAAWLAVAKYEVRVRLALDLTALAFIAFFILADLNLGDFSLAVRIAGITLMIYLRVTAHMEPDTEPNVKTLGALSGSEQIQKAARRAFRKRPEQKGAYLARWGDEADLAQHDMYIDMDQRFERNLALGLRDGHLVGVKEGHAGRKEIGHFLVTGATRAGKGRNLTANAIMWPESLIVLDIKGENYKLTAGLRAQRGRVLALHPNGKGDRYDPFKAMSGSSEGLKTAASIIIDASQDKQPVFGQSAENALYAAFLGAKLENAPTLPYIQALLDEGILGFVAHLASLNDKTINRALTQFLSIKPSDFTLEFYEKSGLVRGAWGSLNTRCSAFMTDGVMAMMSGSDFEPADLYDENTTLYLIFPESEAAATSKAFQIIMISLINSLISVYDAQDAEDQKPERQLLWLLDEAGRTPIPHLDDYIATVAGRNMIFGLYVQDLPQLYDNYNVAERTVRSNIRTQMFYAPTEESTAKYIEGRLGQYSLVQERHTLDGDIELGPFNVPTSMTSEIVRETHRPLLTVDELYQLSLDAVIIFAAATPPLHARRIEPYEIFTDLDDSPKAPPLEPIQVVEYELQTREPNTVDPEERRPEAEISNKEAERYAEPEF